MTPREIVNNIFLLEHPAIFEVSESIYLIYCKNLNFREKCDFY